MLREPGQRGLGGLAVALAAGLLLSCGPARVTAQQGPEAPPTPDAAALTGAAQPAGSAAGGGTATSGAGPASAGAPAAAAPGAPAPPQPGAALPGTVTLVEGTLSEYSISLSQETAPTGTVRFAVQNIGQRRHDLRVVGNGVDQQTPELRPGQSAQLDVTFDEPGIFTVYCDLADHADRGMTTTFMVEDETTFTHS